MSDQPARRSFWQVIRRPANFEEQMVRSVTAIFGGALAIVTVIAAVALWGAWRAHENTGRLERVEAGDSQRSREAGYRNCARDMQTRVELYAAYQSKTRIPRVVRELVSAEPVLQAVLALSSVTRAEGLRRIRRQQPIIDCEANLRGEVPRVLSRKDRERFIADYLAGELDPTPDVVDCGNRRCPTVSFPRGVGPEISRDDPRSPVPNGAPAAAILPERDRPRGDGQTRSTPQPTPNPPPATTAPAPQPQTPEVPGVPPQTTPDPSPRPRPAPPRLPSTPEVPPPVQVPDEVLDQICDRAPVPLVCRARDLLP